MSVFLTKLEEALEAPNLPGEDKWGGVDQFTEEIIEKENKIAEDVAELLGCGYKAGDFEISPIVIYKDRRMDGLGDDYIRIFFDRGQEYTVDEYSRLHVTGKYVNVEYTQDDLTEDSPRVIAEVIRSAYAGK